jgi:replication factor C subunit 3/5
MGRKKLKQISDDEKSENSERSDESESEQEKKPKKRKNIDPMQMYADLMDCVNEIKKDTMVTKKKEENTTLPWIEKFRPKSLANIISHENIIFTLNKFVEKQRLPHLIFRGPPGTGKTSTIMACAKKLYGEKYQLMVLDINASEERGIDAIRGKVSSFVSTKGIFLGKDDVAFKLVILDEADAMTEDAQSALVSVMEKYTLNVRFCLICNYVQKIDPAIQSRCVIFKFAPLSKNNIKQKLNEICDELGLTMTDEGAEAILKIAKGDMRKVLNILQSTSMSYTVINSNNVSNCAGYPTEQHVKEMYSILKNDNFENAYKKLVKILHDNGYAVSDILTELTTTLLDKTNNESNEYLIKKIINMRDIEMNLTSCTNEYTQICALVGAFKI